MNKTSTLNCINEIRINFLSEFNSILKFQIDVPKSIQQYREYTQNELEIISTPYLKSHLETEIKYLNNHLPIVNIMTLIYVTAHFEAFFNKLTNTMLNYYCCTLKNHLIEKELMKFSYLGIKGKIQYYEEKFNLQFSYVRQNGLKFDWNFIELQGLTNTFAERNIILHNGGYINGIYKKITKSKKYEIGDKIQISHDEILPKLKLLMETGDSLSVVCLKKVEG